jgi:23S rRNA maturation-related 3'-5' exoribonuclease YhaM
MPPNTQFSFNHGVDTKSKEIAVCDLLSLIKRPGMESLIDYLLNSDYFTAPASTRYHNVFEGGLCQHSLNVTREFSKENAFWEKQIPQDSVIICGILHDLCKVGAYIETDHGYESVKGLKGHATLSISRINEHIQLTQQEDDIIRYHMGLFGIFTYHEHDTLKIHKAIMRTPHVQTFASIDQADSKRKADSTQSRGVRKW